VRVKKDYDLRELFTYSTRRALQESVAAEDASQEDYLRLVEEKYRPIKKSLEDEVFASGLF